MSEAVEFKLIEGAIEEKAIELISSKADGLYQSELRKLLGINSSRCSKIVMNLERSGIIYREKNTKGDRRTYLITLINPAEDSLASDVQIEHFSRTSPSSNIDTYLTEIYLLYLMRGSEKTCPEEDLHEGLSGDTAADELPDGRSSGDNRPVDCRHMEDRDGSVDLSSSIPDNGRGELSERLLRQGDRCDQQAEEANSQRANQLKHCSEMVIGAIRKRLRSRWPGKSFVPGLSSN